MHGRIATVRVRPGAADRVAEGWRSLLAEYEKTGVFHGMVSLHDPTGDVAVTLTLWASAQAADEVAAPLREKAGALFADLMLEAPSITTYDVLLTALGDEGEQQPGSTT